MVEDFLHCSTIVTVGLRVFRKSAVNVNESFSHFVHSVTWMAVRNLLL